MTNKITFKKVDIAHKEIIFSWLAEPHVQEFWDNTQGHKDDILNFMGGRKAPSNYCDGKYVYWIALDSGKPYAILMTIFETIKDDIGELKLSHLSKTGHTYGLDYMIGCAEHIGKGYGAKTLIEFIDFFRESFDKKADTFLIDPASDNPRAKRVYEKAGFKYIADFVMGGDCSGAGKPHHLLIKQFLPIVNLVTASIDDYPIIQNMARFYVYDMSKECGHISDEWRLPSDGLFKSFDFKSYFEEKSRRSYLIKVYDEIAGFFLLNKNTTEEKNDWNMGEFFILGKFQGKGIGKKVANQIWKDHPGLWEVSVIPENKLALKFWEHAIANYTNNTFKKEVKIIDSKKDKPKRIIFTFSSYQNISITTDLVSRLIMDQFPNYANLDIKPVEFSGIDNRTYHLGGNMLIRLPSAEGYAAQALKEQNWLPELAKHLSILIPTPLQMGKPNQDYPWNWSIYRFIPGTSVNHLDLPANESENLARHLADFIKELHLAPTKDAPIGGLHNYYRGCHPSAYDKDARADIKKLSSIIDADKALALWEAAISTKWESAPVWVHGDMAIGNMLMQDNSLVAVIDFGCMGIGDPACDLVIAWTFFDGKARQIFKNSVGFDPDTWTRARAWALWKANFELSGISDKSSHEAMQKRKIISDVLGELK